MQPFSVVRSTVRSVVRSVVRSPFRSAFGASSRPPDALALPAYVAKWTVLALVVGLLSGTASAFFLWALGWATGTRLAHGWLVWLLPLAGAVVGWLYLRFGSAVEAGNNLLIDEIHDPKRVIPLRMAPLVLLGTVTSHLFGASVGREGTAVQMGGALADQLTHVFRLDREDRRIILMAGIGAGFASVFGTPLAGAVFALEVLAIGRMRYDALLACLVAAVAGDQVCLAWSPFLNIHHTHYALGAVPALAQGPLLAVLVAGAAFGCAGRLFAAAVHQLGAAFKRRVPYAPLRPLLGGLAIAAASLLPGTGHYLGLGIPTIQAAFVAPLPGLDFAGKMAFTVASLASGFKGGEVTPLFYIGATLGNALAPLLHLPFPLLAGLGFVAVFAGAANTPIASTLMALELFGAEVGVYAALACVVSYLFSGHAGIYKAQRIGVGKHGTRFGAARMPVPPAHPAEKENARP